MFEDLSAFDFYTITVTRQHLDKLMGYFSEVGEVSLKVESTGEITFNIPKDSDIDIVEINVLKELIRKLTELHAEQEQVKTRTKRYKEIEHIKNCITVTMEYIVQIYADKLNTKKNENDENT